MQKPVGSAHADRHAHACTADRHAYACSCRRDERAGLPDSDAHASHRNAHQHADAAFHRDTNAPTYADATANRYSRSVGSTAEYS